MGSSKEPSDHRQSTFQIRLGSAYYNQGLINPGAEASRFLGQHGDPVIVYLGNQSEQVDSVINRTANANGSVRVMTLQRLGLNYEALRSAAGRPPGR
jgi:hypothetical protein